MKQVSKVFFTILFIIGFTFLFGESDSVGVQLTCTLGSLVLCGIGYKGLDKLGAFDDDES